MLAAWSTLIAAFILYLSSRQSILVVPVGNWAAKWSATENLRVVEAENSTNLAITWKIVHPHAILARWCILDQLENVKKIFETVLPLLGTYCPPRMGTAPPRPPQFGAGSQCPTPPGLPAGCCPQPSHEVSCMDAK